MAKIIFQCITMLILQVVVQVQLQKTLLPIKHVNTIISNMLLQYPDYDVIIHFDNTTVQETYPFIEDLQDAFQAILLLNYNIKSFNNRPVGYKFLHVVFLTNPFHFGEFCKIPFNVEFNDIIFILRQDNIDNKTIAQNVGFNFWQQYGLERAGSVFVLTLQTSDLYHACFYCGYMSGVLQNISSRKNITAIRNYFNDFSNFHGQHFKIGYMKYLPFFWYKESLESHRLGGPEGKLLEMMSSALNFQYSLENFEDRLDGEWAAMIDAIHYGRLDWAVGGISASTKRAELVDLTKYIHTEMYRILYCCCSSSNNWRQSWQQLMLPFPLWLWLSIGIMLVVITVLLKIVNDYFASNTSIIILKIIEVTMRGLIDQSLIQIPIKCITGRVLLIAWWYFAIIIATVFRSKLASSLIHPYYKQPNSIQELLHEDYTFQVNNEDWSVLKENFEKSADLVLAEVLKRSNNHLNICSSIQQAVQNKVAIIDEETNLQYEVITNCGALLSDEDYSHMRLLAQDVLPSQHVWPLQLAAPYRRKFSMVIENLFASGIISHWYSLASKKRLPSSTHYNDIKSVATPLPISTMVAPALILFVGLLLATIIFVCEITYFSLNYLLMFYRQHKYAVDLNK